MQALNVALLWAAFTPDARLMVMMPPRHGKSELSSRYFPAWYLGCFPNRRIILSSYEAGFAASWGRKARDVIEGFGRQFPVPLSLREDSTARDDWNLKGFDGGMVTAGVGGAITGKGADLGIIDDPIKNAEEARSKLVKDKIWDWYLSTFSTRLHRGGAVVLVMTRWATDDLAGRLLAEAENGGEKWRVLKLPAIDAAGAPLCPELFPLESLHAIRKRLTSFWWESLYQQEPHDREGEVFKVGRIKTLEAAPRCVKIVRAWDFAATEAGVGDPDYTTGVKMGRTAEGRYVVLHVVRGRWSPLDTETTAKQTAQMDGKLVFGHIPQDPGQAGKSQAAHLLARIFEGYPYSADAVTGDKSLRAMPFAAQVEAGNVDMVRAPWNQDFIDELRAFPNGAHDDQVDASSDAFAQLVGGVGKLMWV